MPIQKTIGLLKAGAGLNIFFGMLLALGAWSGTEWPVKFLGDIVFWPIDGAQSLEAPETRLLSAISGGLLCGLGVLIWQVAAHFYEAQPRQAGRAILLSVTVWFVIDSIGSVVAGAPVNVILNLPFLLVFAIPLMKCESRTAL